MRNKIKIVAYFCLFMSFFSNSAASAEPFIVLEFSSQTEFSEGDGNNLFSIDPDHSENYMVKTGDSLN